ncbi:molybdopterin molybdotransferase MoeA [Sphingomonas sp. ID0503]|uniref:molybdopterin molybdotransferase MoeA n=1 Tax=Sphingomonas sp. ID0503 TaxID=3399691 RepID=UPI003AFA1C2E
MISFDEAFDRAVALAEPLGAERIAIGAARGRVLAEPVVAAIDSPRADVSMMDGYAVRDGETGPWQVIGASYPGVPFTGSVKAGQAVRIFTGAMVPSGAGRVLVQEIVACDGERAALSDVFGTNSWIRQRASDFGSGTEMLGPGTVLDAGALILAAGCDAGEVIVHRRPRVRIVTTGDELTAPGQAAANNTMIPESVSIGIAALSDAWGAVVQGAARIGDELAAIAAAAGEALETADVLVMTGGASVGEKDFAKAAVVEHELELAFSGVAMRPGKPVWAGRTKGRVVIGLPGNPGSALVTARLLLVPMLLRLGGRQAEDAAQWEQATLDGALPPCDTRETFARGRLDRGRVRPVANQDSGAQAALALSNAVIRQRPGTPALSEGARVEVLRF